MKEQDKDLEDNNDLFGNSLLDFKIKILRAGEPSQNVYENAKTVAEKEFEDNFSIQLKIELSYLSNTIMKDGKAPTYNELKNSLENKGIDIDLEGILILCPGLDLIGLESASDSEHQY